MIRWHWLTQAMALAGVLLLVAWLSGTVAAQTQPARPNPPLNGCMAPMAPYGHWQTKWRHWPGQTPLDQINPRAFGAEVLPRPEGREIVPLPKAAPRQPLPPQQEQQPAPGGESVLPPLEGKILPPEGTILPPEGMLPLTPGIQPSAPGEGALPGLPAEPDTSLLPLPTEKPLPEAEPTENKSPKPADAEPKIELKVEPKPAEVVPPKDAPKSNAGAGIRQPAEVAGLSSAWRNDGPPSEAPAAPVLPGVKNNNAVISLAGGMEPERSTLLPGAYHADSIAVAPPGSSPHRVEATSYAAAGLPSNASFVDRADIPSVALNGYCPVELSRNGRWVAGDLRWTVVHKGHIYRLSGTEQWRQFSADPDAFAPVNSGIDVVLAAREHRTTPGKPTYCATYNGHLYMFSSEATQAEFNKNPQWYAGE